MSKGVTNSWALNQSTFNKVIEKIRKKRKKVYILFTKAGDSYKPELRIVASTASMLEEPLQKV